MQSATQPAAAKPSAMLWTGRALSGLIVVLLFLDAIAKVLRLPAVVEGTVQIGYSEGLVRPIGIVLLLCLVVYAIPRSAVLGAILLTGYLGGAVAATVRVHNPLFWMPALLGVVVWGAVFLRDGRLRALLPLRR